MDVLNPVVVEQHIRRVAERIAKSAGTCNDLYKTYLEAQRVYDHAYAKAYMVNEGPAHAKRYAAELDTTELRKDRDQADAAYRYADRLAKALTEELRAYQSIGASVRMMYGVAGRGEQ